MPVRRLFILDKIPKRFLPGSQPYNSNLKAILSCQSVGISTTSEVFTGNGTVLNLIVWPSILPPNSQQKTTTKQQKQQQLLLRPHESATSRCLSTVVTQYTFFNLDVFKAIFGLVLNWLFLILNFSQTRLSQRKIVNLIKDSLAYQKQHKYCVIVHGRVRQQTFTYRMHFHFTT